MTPTEEDRIVNFKTHIEVGKKIFQIIKDYYTNEYELNSLDTVEFSENVLMIKYLYRPYLIEIFYNEELKLGQLIIYESEIGTHFLPEPKFKLKDKSKLFFDYVGNLYINNSQVAHPYPKRAGEDIIREITKQA